jgi:hypothetical protein
VGAEKQGEVNMKAIRLEVAPGICGFTCRIEATCGDKRTARMEIIGSECSMVQQLRTTVREVGMEDIFVPLTQNKIFLAAEQAGCHLACPVPVALVKAAEVALRLALPQDVSFTFAAD